MVDVPCEAEQKINEKNSKEKTELFISDEVDCQQGRIQTGGTGGTCPLQIHGQQKWSSRLEHDSTEIRAVQNF